jgi:predicted PolB exonuclease-like 3'-5' exonuclease
MKMAFFWDMTACSLLDTESKFWRNAYIEEFAQINSLPDSMVSPLKESDLFSVTLEVMKHVICCWNITKL